MLYTALMDAAASSPLQNLTLQELSAFFAERGVTAHQARLAFQAMHRAGELDGERMPAISPACRAFLRTLPPPPRLKIDAVLRAQDGTVKLRIALAAPPAAVETVIIPGARRVTVCLSSQMGCAADCSFCHTGTMGLQRNLTAWELLEQVRLARLFWEAERTPSQPPVSNLVFMGMGEPLHNTEAVARACRILNDAAGAGFSKRHIVVSTVGAGDRIRHFWDENTASLALSLHAATDELRNELVPLNRRWNLAALRRILLDIPWRHRETLTVAYLLLDGVNDTLADAQRLAQWCEGLPVKVNLLEFNPYPGCGYARATPEKLAAFRQWLHDAGLFNTLRQSRGGDVMAACGQLAAAPRQRKQQRPAAEPDLDR